ncbi:hypothetical protein [Limnoglobus roseus]|uniref:Uncharacterized protein n=1 Tax=Limnoglobus roseus TaxID=2598579 RepID=A0A5C1AG92_9BACT|nr:hypothetical protein [Limnoglobus roseus]QEL17006.1 hypothetical protein PX52LOC_03982 [Limnoglobus roseus]
MSLETIIDFPCRVKKDLGHGDPRAGTPVLLDLIAVRERIEQVRASTRPDYLSVDLPVRLLRMKDGSPVEQSTTLGQLEAEAIALDPHVPVCTNCPVNARRAPFGCVVVVRYPVKKSAERWLLDRVQPPDTIGGAMCLESLIEANADGEPTRDHRTRGLLEAFPGLDRDLPKNVFDKPELTADELLQLLLLSRGKFVPWQSLNILLWFGAIKLEETVPTTADDALKLARLEPVDRAKRAKLFLGQSDSDAGIEDWRNFLKALFVGWVRDVEVLIDSR